MATDTLRVKELSSALRERQAYLREGLDKGVTIVDGSTVSVSSSAAAELKQAKADVDQIRDLIRMELACDEAKGMADSIDNGDFSMKSLSMGGQRVTPEIAEEAKSIGARFVESDEFKSFRRTGRLTMDSPWTRVINDLPGFQQKDVFTGSVDPLPTLGFGRVQFDPMVPRAQRRNRVRSLFPQANTSANLIDFFQVMGFLENSGSGNAQTVPERRAADEVSAPTGGTTDVFGLKPRSNLRFQSRQAPVRTIAHWEAAHRNVLADEPQLQATIDNELLYGLALREDDQILNGDGEGENLLGLLNTDGIQHYTQEATDRRSDGLRKALTLTVLANYPSTGFVLNPLDWEKVELQKASGDGHYMLATNIAIGADQRVWRTPVVESPAMPEGTFATGAWGLGAQLYDNQLAGIRISEQHEDFFVRNAIVILCEERLAFAVKRPEAFVKGTFDTTLDDEGAS